MTIPGFIAEASLYKPSGYYHMDGTFAAVAGNQSVIPAQFSFCDLFPGFCQILSNLLSNRLARLSTKLQCVPTTTCYQDPTTDNSGCQICYRSNCDGTQSVWHTRPTPTCYQDPATDDPRCQICYRDNCDGTASMWHTC